MFVHLDLSNANHSYIKNIIIIIRSVIGVERDIKLLQFERDTYYDVVVVVVHAEQNRKDVEGDSGETFASLETG